MITVISRWETSQMEPELEWRMWRQLRGAFHIDRLMFVPVIPSMEGYTFEQYDTVDEALAHAEGMRVFLEPKGQRSIFHMPKHSTITLVCGNTQQHNLGSAQLNETYRIPTPGSTDLYGINAAAIALAVRCL